LFCRALLCMLQYCPVVRNSVGCSVVLSCVTLYVAVLFCLALLCMFQCCPIVR